MFYFRTDANPVIASGHVMRCITVANELRQNGEQCVFLLSDDAGKALVNQAEFPYISLKTSSDDYDHCAEELINLGIFDEHSVLLTDSYAATPRFFEFLSGHVPLAYLGSKQEKFPGLSLLVNYSNTFDPVFYKQSYQGSLTRLLLGAKYTPLRKEYQQVSFHVRDTVSDLMISTGGGDTENSLGCLIAMMRETYPTIKLHAVAGALNENIRQLQTLYQHDDMVELHICVKTMSQLMVHCDLAIITAGTTAFEVCACGLPSVCISIVKEQERDGRKFAADNVMVYAGNIVEHREETVSAIKKAIHQLVHSTDKRRLSSEKMRKYVDGKGAARIADSLMALKKTFSGAEQ